MELVRFAQARNTLKLLFFIAVKSNCNQREKAQKSHILKSISTPPT